jgi:hypothetical protein
MDIDWTTLTDVGLTTLLVVVIILMVRRESSQDKNEGDAIAGLTKAIESIVAFSGDLRLTVATFSQDIQGILSQQTAILKEHMLATARNEAALAGVILTMDELRDASAEHIQRITELAERQARHREQTVASLDAINQQLTDLRVLFETRVIDEDRLLELLTAMQQEVTNAVNEAVARIKVAE